MLVSEARKTNSNSIWNLVPTICRFCGQPIEVSDDLMHIYCSNPDCDSKVGRKIEIMAKALGIDNIGLKVAAELADRPNINSPIDIFSLSEEDLIGICGWKKPMAAKVYREIHKDLSDTPFDKFIRACQIKRVGEGSSKVLARVCPTIEKLVAVTVNDLVSCGDRTFGAESSSQVVDYIHNHKDMIVKLYDIVYPNGRESVEVSSSQINTDTKYNVVITGSLSMPRKEFQEIYSAKGIKFQSDVSSTTNVLVCNSPSSSSKSKKAKQFGIPIMTEEEFKEFICR